MGLKLNQPIFYTQPPVSHLFLVSLCCSSLCLFVCMPPVSWEQQSSLSQTAKIRDLWLCISEPRSRWRPQQARMGQARVSKHWVCIWKICTSFDLNGWFWYFVGLRSGNTPFGIDSMPELRKKRPIPLVSELVSQLPSICLMAFGSSHLLNLDYLHN